MAEWITHFVFFFSWHMQNRLLKWFCLLFRLQNRLLKWFSLDLVTGNRYVCVTCCTRNLVNNSKCVLAVSCFTLFSWFSLTRAILRTPWLSIITLQHVFDTPQKKACPYFWIHYFKSYDYGNTVFRVYMIVLVLLRILIQLWPFSEILQVSSTEIIWEYVCELTSKLYTFFYKSQWWNSYLCV